MPDLVINVLQEIVFVLYEGSLFILVGFLIAGVLQELLPPDAIARHLGGDTPRSVALASLFGAPIPLCSCGVLPAAAALQRKGASRSSLLSFLISTPETGVDSIALTYGLLGPVMAIVRPIVAVLTALVAGLVSIGVRGDRSAPPPAAVDSCCDDDCGDTKKHLADCPNAAAGVWARTQRVFRFGFVTLLDDIAFWLAAGIVLTGILAALVPDDFFSTVLGWDQGLMPMLAMIVVGVPLYLCASASTPVAAALIAKGLSPGAALVFLLVGPATNAATLTVVGRLLGGVRLRIYLGSIIVVSIAAGLLLDAFAADLVRGSTLTGGAHDHGAMSAVKWTAAAIFVLLVIVSFARTRFREARGESRDQLRRLADAVRAIRVTTPAQPSEAPPPTTPEPVNDSDGASHRSR